MGRRLGCGCEPGGETCRSAAVAWAAGPGHRVPGLLRHGGLLPCRSESPSFGWLHAGPFGKTWQPWCSAGRAWVIAGAGQQDRQGAPCGPRACPHLWHSCLY